MINTYIFLVTVILSSGDISTQSMPDRFTCEIARVLAEQTTELNFCLVLNVSPKIKI